MENNRKTKKSLAETNPELVAEWDHEKNGSLTPEDVTAGSHKDVWWKCKNGHSWQAKMYARSKGGGCPYCSGYYAIKGETDLATD